MRGIGGPEDGKVTSGEVGLVVDRRVVGSDDSGSEAMSALSDTGCGIGELEKMTTVGKDRRIEEG